MCLVNTLSFISQKNGLNKVSFRIITQIQLYDIEQLLGFNFGVLQFLSTFSHLYKI